MRQTIETPLRIADRGVIPRAGDGEEFLDATEQKGVREMKGFHCIEELRIILDLPPGHPVRQPRSGENSWSSGN